MIAGHLKTAVFRLRSQPPAPELQTPGRADDSGDQGVASDLFCADLPKVYQLPPGEFQATAPRRALSPGLPAPGRRPASTLFHGASRRHL